MKFGPIARLFLRIALGSVFIVSGFQKLIAPPQNFAAVIEKFEIVQGPAAALLSVTLPWIELIAGVLFVLGLWTTVALVVLWLMNTVFAGVLISALIRRLPVEQCGCFGKALSIPLPVMIGIDAVIWIIFLVSFVSRKKPAPSLDAILARHD